MTTNSNDGTQLGLPSRRVWELAGMPPSTLDYWVQIGLVVPSLRGSTGRRAERWWSLRDVLIVRTIRTLRQAGASLQHVRAAKEAIERWGNDFTAVNLFYDGTEILVSDDAGVHSTRRLPGQQVFKFVVLPLDRWHEALQADPKVVAVDVARMRAKDEARAAIEADRAPAPLARLLRSAGPAEIGDAS